MNECIYSAYSKFTGPNCPKISSVCTSRESCILPKFGLQEFNFGTIPVNSCLPEKFHREGYSGVCGGSPLGGKGASFGRERMSWRVIVQDAMDLS